MGGVIDKWLKNVELEQANLSEISKNQ